jgi:hypothetical protein
MLSHETAADEVVAKAKASGLVFDGLYNFWEDNVALSAQVRATLGLKFRLKVPYHRSLISPGR